MTNDQYLSFGCNAHGSPLLRVRVLSWFAALLNVQFKIGGQPYGALYERAINQTEARKTRHTGQQSAGIQSAGQSIGSSAAAQQQSAALQGMQP